MTALMMFGDVFAAMSVAGFLGAMALKPTARKRRL